MFREYKAITLVTFLFASTILAQEKKEAFYNQISRAIIRLEHTALIMREGQENIESKKSSNGTAFFVARENELYIVSAGHVVDKGYDLQARVLCKNNLTNENDLLLLKLPKERWIYHNIIGDQNTNRVDVAVQKIAKAGGHNIMAFLFESKESESHNINQLPYENPTPPKAIISFGFPLDIGFELKEQRPFGRTGIVAMVTGKEFLKLKTGKFADAENIILDIDMFPGNSGSPVINQTGIGDPKLKLLGLITATNTNMKFAIMEPVSRIIETLELAKNQDYTNLRFWY